MRGCANRKRVRPPAVKCVLKNESTWLSNAQRSLWLVSPEGVSPFRTERRRAVNDCFQVADYADPDLFTSTLD